ncbi:Guanine deaminase [Tetrabaena socialis]|uniref:Guanine deaminase n=1 Tax=Tetrabaena socialis TaxID=47790 RepID=A0A2J8AHE4_9CHLO|nr:Guanine deaminase [Tetrabaena socialis]|eukprot:PNH11926.1 Guanine deaminase [Tetrabaena socialis]
MAAPTTIFRGTFFHTPAYGQLDALRDTLVVVQDGKIARIAPGSEEAAVMREFGLQQVRQLQARMAMEGQYFVPGFIDTHVHAPQYKFTGTGTDVPLMDWLEKYTFPSECSFRDLEAAQHRYSLLVKRFLANGTTTAMYYGSLHLAPNTVLVDTIEALGQRAVVGKVNMDRHSPEDYMESTADGLRDAEEFLKYTLAKKSSRIMPCITPRFIPTCTPELMKVAHALSLGLKVGLGTDVAGGISPSMLTAQRMAVVNSRCLRAHKLAVAGGTRVTPEMETDVITFKEALWLATMGGAQALDLADRIGSFEVGKEFDALLVDTAMGGTSGPFDVFADEDDLNHFEKFINLGDDRNLVEVYVQGVCVKRGSAFLLDPTSAVPTPADEMRLMRAPTPAEPEAAPLDLAHESSDGSMAAARDGEGANAETADEADTAAREAQAETEPESTPRTKRSRR